MNPHGVSGLMVNYFKHNPDGHFFDESTLKFFGERLSEMRVLKKRVKYGGHDCIVLSKYSRNYPGGPKRTYAYFDVETYEYIG